MRPTEYFYSSIEERGLTYEQVLTALQHEHKRIVQDDGRTRIYGWLPEREYFMRIILTRDGRLLNAFLDRDYTRKKHMSIMKEAKEFGLRVHYDREVDILRIKLGNEPGPFGEESSDSDVMFFYNEEGRLTEIEINHASQKIAGLEPDEEEPGHVFPFMSVPDLGRLAKRLRSRQNKSQSEVARMLGVNQSNISRAEQGNPKYLSVMSAMVKELGEYEVSPRPLIKVEKKHSKRSALPQR